MLASCPLPTRPGCAPGSPPARSARRTPPARPAAAGAPPRAPAPRRPATWGRAGRSRRASRSPPEPPPCWPTSTGPGRITHIWLTTHPDHWRSMLLRAHWDGDPTPAVEVPLGDFFGQGWGRFAQLSSAMVAVNPHGGMNSYWPMPFRAGARLTCENLSDRPGDPCTSRSPTTTGGDEAGSGYLHAQWRRSNPRRGRGCTRCSTACGAPASTSGTYLAWGVNSRGWWGEGEIKFYLDGDERVPDDLRHRHRGLLRRRLELRRAGPGLHRLHHALPRPAPDHPARTGSTRASSASACTAGTCPTRSGSPATCGSTSRRWAGAPAGATCARHDDIASTALFYLDATSTARPPVPGPDELEAL